MKLRGYEIRGIVILLTLMILGVMAACGGGGKSAHRAVLPQLDGSGSTASQGGKYGFSFTEADIPNLSPEIQELLALPGWDGPPSPIPPVSGAPMPEPPTVEDLIAMKRDLMEQSDGLYRNEEPVVPVVKDTSYPVIPPDDPGYYPLLGEYDPDDWDPGGGDTPPPPFGVDDDEDGYEDLFENADDYFVTVYKSFVKEGQTTANQFNRGTLMAGDPVSAVYQSFRDQDGSNATGEFQYRAEESGILLHPYTLNGLWYKQFNMATSLTRYSDPTTVMWYSVMIAAASEVNDNGGAHFESTGCPNVTLADYQAFSYDPDKLPLLNVSSEGWDDNGSLVGSIMTSLVSSENENIQELIGEQTSTGDPVATFGCIGMILQRWSDDRFSPYDHAWQGRLGWPLSDPFVDRNGRVLVGPLGQYRRYGQWFERGFIWWNDYLDPSTPDELYVYTTEEDSVLDPDAELTQDAMVVRYGLGGPLGMAITAYPLLANIGDPIYFHAFPYGGPLTNANAFDDDVFVWNWRDGNYYIGDGTETLRTHDFLVEAKYVPRVLLVLDVDGDGNADGSNPDYVCFADSPEIEIGHISSGSGAAQIVVVTEDSPYPGDDNADAIKETLDSLDIAYDEMMESDISDVSDLEDYLLTIWAFPEYPNYMNILNDVQIELLMDITQTNNQDLLIVWHRPYYYYNWYQGSYRYTWPNYLGTTQYSYPSSTYYITTNTSMGINTTGLPLGSGPGGTIATIKWDWTPYPYIPGYYQSPYFAYLYYLYLTADVTVLSEGPYYYYKTSWMRDTNGGDENGIVSWFGLNWNLIESTAPAAPGREGVMQNLLNQINPDLLEGGGGGGDEVRPWDGPVDIADIFGWIVDSEAGDMSGGTDMDINVVGGPETVEFECLARASAGVDLVYEWEFEPGDGYSIWTRYTSHVYVAAIDVDGDGDTSYDDDDWFTVNARVYDSLYGSYAGAPVDSRDSDVFDMRVSGGITAVWIEDDGTVFENPYEIDGSGNITVGLDYEVGGGDHNYNGIWIDYDYDFVTFNDTVEVTPTGSNGSFHYNLVIPDAQGGYEYYIAIKVYDDDAPNLSDTYAWLEPVMAGAGVMILNDGDTEQADLFADDLDDIGISYAELNRSDIGSASDLSGYGMVIWCAENTASTSPPAINEDEQDILVDYVEGGGDLLITHNYFGSQDLHIPYDPYNGTPFMDMFGVHYAVNINWSGNQNYLYSEDPWSSGPGGNITTVHTSTNYKGHANVSWPDYQNPPNNDHFAYIATFYMPPGPEPHFGVAWGKDNLPSTNPGGKAAFWSPRWPENDQDSQRQNLLKNALDWFDPDLLP